MARKENPRAIAKRAIEEWSAENPRKLGETVRQYRKRMQDGVGQQLQGRYGSSVWLAILMQFLPLLIEWFTNRRS
jgi:hypothetical protein